MIRLLMGMVEGTGAGTLIWLNEPLEYVLLQAKSMQYVFPADARSLSSHPCLMYVRHVHSVVKEASGRS